MPMTIYDKAATDKAIADAIASGGGGGAVIFEHGSNAAAIRPTAPGRVEWVGSIRPNNWVDGDLWWDTTASSGGGGGTTPTMPSGLVAKWSARSLSALADGATVSSWVDSVGSLALTASGTPLYNAAGKFVQYDGVDDRHDATGAAALAQPTTTIAVFRLPGTLASVPIVGSATAIHSLSTTSAGLLQVNAGTAVARPGALTVGQWYMGTFVANGASSSGRVGNEAPTTGNAGTNSRASVRVASNTTASAFGRVDMKGILLFSRALTDAEISDVRTLLAAELEVTL